LCLSLSQYSATQGQATHTEVSVISRVATKPDILFFSVLFDYVSSLFTFVLFSSLFCICTISSLLLWSPHFVVFRVYAFVSLVLCSLHLSCIMTHSVVLSLRYSLVITCVLIILTLKPTLIVSVANNIRLRLCLFHAARMRDRHALILRLTFT
jgi:hypothetical protein